jgi:hypothetical protein
VASPVLDGKDYAVMLLRGPSAILTILRFRPKGGQERIYAIPLPGLDSEVLPDKMTKGEGTIIPHYPEELAETKYYLQDLWADTRRPMSD